LRQRRQVTTRVDGRLQRDLHCSPVELPKAKTRGDRRKQARGRQDDGCPTDPQTPPLGRGG
jgi:hypothetical protein